MIREASIEDCASLYKLGIYLRADYAHLFPLEEILKQDYSHIYIYIIDNQIVGFLHIEDHYEIMDIINIVVDPQYRRRGIASALYEYATSKTEALKVLLEVKDTNEEALRLYQKWGFEKINIRENYYLDANAIIMERKLK